MITPLLIVQVISGYSVTRFTSTIYIEVEEKKINTWTSSSLSVLVPSFSRSYILKPVASSSRATRELLWANSRVKLTDS